MADLKDVKVVQFNENQLTVDDTIELIKALKLTKDLKTEIMNIGSVDKSEVKMLVDLYYQQQKYRKSLREQIRSIEQGRATGTDNTNVAILNWVLNNVVILEHGISKILELVVSSDKVGRWLMDIVGIGHVLAAGLLASFDVKGREYATQFISYAGLNDNNRPWLGKEKSKEIINDIVGKTKVITNDMVYEIANKTQWPYNYLMQKAYDQEKYKWSKDKLIAACSMIPYNKEVKTLMFKVGSSFQWMCNKPNSLYGRLYSERKQLELKRNEEGANKEYCEKALATKTFDKSTETYKAYSAGKIPLAQINMRAIRWVEKIFISHLFEEMYRVEYNKVPPRYYSLVHMEGQHNKDIAPEVPYTLVESEL